MTTLDAAISVHIEGIAGTWGWGPRPETASTIAYPDWIAGALAVRPQPASEGYDPDTGAIMTARVTIEINGRVELRPRLLYQATEPVARIVSLGSSTTCVLDRVVSVTIGQTVYLAGESLVVTAVSGATLTVARGAHGSTSRAWAAGDWIWLAPPFWRRRRLLIRSWPSGQVVWRGLLDQPPRTSADGSRIVLDASGPQVLESELLVGYGAADASAQGPIVAGLRAPHTTKLLAPEWIALQIGDVLYTGQRLPSGGYRAATGALLGSGDVFRARPTGDQRAFEVLATGRLVPPAIDPLASSGCAYPYHPVTLACALLFSRARAFVQASTYDVLSTRWSAGLYDFTSPAALAGIAEQIEATRWQQIDHVVLGWSGATTQVIPYVRTLLLAWGWVIASTTDGSLTIVRAPRAASVADVLDALQPTRDLARWEQPRGGVADAVVATIGALPWMEGATLRVVVAGAQAAYPESGETQTLDLSSVALSRAGASASGRLLTLALARWRGQPEISVRLRGDIVPALGELYRLRDIAGLTTPIWMSPDGVPISRLEEVPTIGQVITRRWLVSEGTYEVTMRLTSWPLGGPLRLRAPSATITAVSGASLILAGDYGQLGQVADTYRVGELVQAWTPGGVRVTDHQEIIGIGGAIVTLTAALSPAPSIGDILRVVDLADAPTPRYWTYVEAGDRYA